MNSAAEDGPSGTILAGWGTSRHGQLGPSSPSPSPSPSVKPEPFRSSPHILKMDAGTVATCALGNQHTVILGYNGTVMGLGSDRKAQLSGIDAWTNVSAIGCTWNATYGVVRSPTDRGSFWILATGSNNHGQLGVAEHTHESTSTTAFTVPFPFEPGSRQIVKIACGSEHVLCLLSAHGDTLDDRSVKERRELWAWGWNEHGNLGMGDVHDVWSPTRVRASSNTVTSECELDEIVDVWAGCGTSWILVQQT